MVQTGMITRSLVGLLLLSGAVAPQAAQAVPRQQIWENALDALRLDFGRDGVVASPDEIAGRYQQACDAGYDLACRWSSWRNADGLPSIEAAGESFQGRCTRNDPVACIVVGWAIEASPLPENLVGHDRIQAADARLGRAYPHYVTGCDTGFAGACHELARYSIERFRLGVGDAKLLERRERGARAVFDMAGCQKGFQPSCVALGQLQPQSPDLMDDKGSAGQYYTSACQAGYINGCYHLNLLVANNRTLDENRSRFEDLCDRGHTDSCTWVAKSYREDQARSPEAIAAWRRACLLQDARGCRIAGEAAEAQSPAQAIAVHRMGCVLGDGTSCGRLGLLLVQQDRAVDALDALDRGCASGISQACVKVGLLRLEGQEIDADPARARRDLRAGCPDEGERDPEACHALGSIHEDGFGVERDRSVAAGFYHHACRAEHIPSCFRLGESVRGLQRASQTDTLQSWALQGYVKACDSGISQACMPAAELFARGPASIRDNDEARRRYATLCNEHEDPLGCRRHGAWLLDRPIDSSDPVLAREAFERGMELGDSESARQLARMYWYGRGGPTKRGKARRLFRQACRDGNGMACGGVRQPDFARP